MVGEHLGNVAKLSSEDRLSYLQMEIGAGPGDGREEGLLLDFEDRERRWRA